MNFITAVKTCFSKYFDFSGRAGRSEYWWFYLLGVTIGITTKATQSEFFAVLLLLLVIPMFSVTARRLHDINKSGWWQLISILPLIGMIILWYWTAKKGNPNKNLFGETSINLNLEKDGI